MYVQVTGAGHGEALDRSGSVSGSAGGMAQGSLPERLSSAEAVSHAAIMRLPRRATESLPMSRVDIADYLGLTIETVCRVLSSFKRDRLIGIPNAHHIELHDRAALGEA
jgi:hypothetical protein